MHASIGLTCFSELFEELFDDFMVFVCHFGMAFFPSVFYVLFELGVLDERKD